MSHQSLKDLTDVTGSPTDGQILKYTASSSSWGPAAESGGGSSGAEYFESWSYGTAGTVADGGLLLDTSSPTYIVHNSIPAASLFKRADAPSGISYDSGTWGASAYDNMYWIGQSSTAKYLLEVELICLYNSTSTTCPIFEWARVSSNHSTQYVQKFGRFPNLSNNSAYTYTGTEASYFTAGKLETFTGRILIDASLSTGANAMSLAIKEGLNASSTVYFPTSFGDTPDLAVKRRHVRLTKIA